MNVTLTINATTPQELQKLLALISGAEATVYQNDPITQGPSFKPLPTFPDQPQAEPVKRGPGRPPKAEPAAPAPKRDMEAAKAAAQVAAAAITHQIMPESERAQATREAQEAQAPVKKTVEKPVELREQVMQSLKKVNDTLGLPKAREILQSYGAQRISEIKESDYQAFINTCAAAVG